jgi:phosphotriesterase-related protein
MQALITTLGPVPADRLGLILPHEHIFVDLRTWDQPGYAQAETDDVIALMGPEIEQARQAGVTALVECSAVGVGRRADILKAVSHTTEFPIVVPTGVYREPWVPDWVHTASEDDLYRWMLGELTGEIENSGVQAGWIKLSAGDDGLTGTETKILRAAGRAGKEAGAAIGSHTIRGRVVTDQLDVLAGVGFPAERFIWIHAQVEPDFDLNLSAARRGAWIEYDDIGSDESDARALERIQSMLAAGLGNQILLSMDRGWYDPALPGGGQPRSLAYLSQSFIPKMRGAGIPEALIESMTRHNPFNAFAR